ncbi:uncharacterized protein LOC116167597 [Photinus pyralis]|uniref:uncharacterized protein LOC116158968 n=1 Tax=Photinus pyralis TaxID=7054 RepID=UPI0012674D8E|nr:uncharacterized protein LOC116158968 [Photinus pyralis]XP_031337999.1 uncharacterized protein LOC116166924 [Photinus pyralis]XP_031338852.1 uncharacterized protein LOC116167597 [Photinus pyralis]
MTASSRTSSPSTSTSTTSCSRHESNVEKNTVRTLSAVTPVKKSNYISNKQRSMVESFVDVMKVEEHQQLTALFAKAVFTSNTPLSITENRNWKLFFKRLRPSFTLPGRYLLSHRLLDEEFERVQIHVEETLNISENLALQCDGWSNLRNESVINVIITTPRPLFVKSVLSGTASHTATYLEGIMLEIIEKYGSHKFSAIVTDNAANMRKAARNIQEKYPHIVSYGCMAHTLHLMCSDILRVESVEQIIVSVKNIVKTIMSSQILRAKLEEIKKDMKLTTSLSMPVKTRWGSHVKSMEDLVKCKFALQRLSITEDTQKVVHTIKPVILSEDFWVSVEGVINLLKPITQSITLLEGDSPSIHLVCKSFNAINLEFDSNLQLLKLQETERNNILQKFSERQQYAMQPVHMAADLLNPHSVGSYLSSEQKMRAMKFINGLAKDMMLPTAIAELGHYMGKLHFFAENFLWEVLPTVDAITWWKGYCGDLSLSKLAVRILTMPCTSAATERSFSTQSLIHTNRRNRLTSKRAIKLNYIQHNSKLFSSQEPTTVQDDRNFQHQQSNINNPEAPPTSSSKEKYSRKSFSTNQVCSESSDSDSNISWTSDIEGNGNSDDDFSYNDTPSDAEEEHIDETPQTKGQKRKRDTTCLLSASHIAGSDSKDDSLEVLNCSIHNADESVYDPDPQESLLESDLQSISCKSFYKETIPITRRK